MIPEEIHAAVEVQMAGHSNPLVVVTGGEPFRQNLAPLIEESPTNWNWNIETNGTMFKPLNFNKVRTVRIICSPKTGNVNSAIRHYAHSFKFVVAAGCTNPATGLPTRVLGNPCAVYDPSEFRVRRPDRVYIQPEDSHDPETNKANLNEAVSICQKFGYRLSVQLHKIIGME